MSALSTQNDALRRRSNFFRGTGHGASTIIAQAQGFNVAPQDERRAAPLADDAITERDKLEVIERHITAFAGTLPAGSLSDANKQDIRSRAMRGGSSTSAIMASVMQAVAVVKPTLQPQVANYYSSAAGGDAGSSDGLRGLEGRPGSHNYAGAFGLSGARGGAGYSGRGDYASFGSSSGNMSGSSYMSNPGSVSMVNYAGTPYAAAGMTHSTFSYLRDDLRQEKFSGTNILHSGQDARTNGFSPNDKKIAKAFAVLDRDDGARRAARNTQLGVLDNRLSNDAEIIRLKAERDKATGEARAKLDEQLVARGLVISKETGTRAFLDAAPTAAAREQGRVVEMEKIKKATGAQIALQAKLGDDVMLGNSTADNVRIAQSATGQPNTPATTAPAAAKPILEQRVEVHGAKKLDSIMGDFASLDTAKPAEPQTKAASAAVPPVTDSGQRQAAATPGGEADTPAGKTPAAADAGQTKSVAATPPAAAPVQAAEAKPAAKPKAPGASMSA